MAAAARACACAAGAWAAGSCSRACLRGLPPATLHLASLLHQTWGEAAGQRQAAWRAPPGGRRHLSLRAALAAGEPTLSTPQTPLCERPAVHEVPLGSLLEWREAAAAAALAEAAAWDGPDDPSPEDLQVLGRAPECPPRNLLAHVGNYMPNPALLLLLPRRS